MPFFMIYGLSNFTFFWLYRVAGYRKKVVFKNLKNSFPEKSEEELKGIMTRFYRHFCDLIFEALKGFTISEKQITKRMVFKNPEVLDKFADQGKDVVLVGGHYNNWELFAVGMGPVAKHIPVGIYKPLKNKFFDGKMRGTRERYGMRMVPMKMTKKFFETPSERSKALIFGADQSPSNPYRCYWTTFLNQDSGVFLGPEKYARDYNIPLVYGTINKIKRGYYEVDYKEVNENPNDHEPGWITEQHVKWLERDIVEKPEYWLWTHKRWKKEKPDDYVFEYNSSK